MAEKHFYGTQTFLNLEGKEKGKEKQIVYKFSDKADLQKWMDADMSVYQTEKPEKKLSRQQVSAKEAGKLTDKGATVKEFLSQGEFKIEGSYAHVSHVDEKYKDHFGVVARFKDDEERDAFIKRNKDYYGDNMKPIKSSDKRAIAANVNGALLRYDDDKRFDSKLKMALKNYPQLNPAKANLAVIAQKENFAKPEVYSFTSKSLRDAFVKTINGSKNSLPITADRLNNFSSIAVSHAARGQIMEGTLGQHYEHFKQYLSMNNASHKSVQNLVKKSLTQMEFDKSVAAGQREFNHVDMRTLAMPDRVVEGFSFKNCDFTGKNLDDTEFKKCDFSGANLRDTSLNKTRFDGCVLDKTSFRNARSELGATSFKNVSANQADFKYSKLPEADFRDASLVRANFYKSDLSNTVTVGAKLSGAEFNSANLSGALMDQNKSAYKDVSFKNANLKGSAIENSVAPKGIAPRKVDQQPAMAR